VNVRQAGGESKIVGLGYQARFLFLLLLISAFGTIFLFLYCYSVLTHPITGTYSAVYFVLRNLSGLLLRLLGVSIMAYFLLVGVGVAVLCAFALHKIAGPLYRLERALENYASGDPIRVVFLREGDQLTALARAFNGFVAHFREDRQRWLAMMEHAERLCLQDAAACRAEMGNALTKLSDQLSRYR